MAELVAIPVSFFELIGEYQTAAIHLLTSRAAVVQALFDALQPWSPSIDDVETHTSGKHSEQGVTFRLPAKRVSFFFGAATCRFVRDAVNWESADETINILDTCLRALSHHGGVTLRTWNTAIGLHLQPKAKPFTEVLRPFLANDLAALGTEPLQTMAVVAKWGTRRVTLDGSAVLANALFVKLERQFQPSTDYETMAKQIREDEDEMLRILGVEEEIA